MNTIMDFLNIIFVKHAQFIELPGFIFACLFDIWSEYNGASVVKYVIELLL